MGFCVWHLSFGLWEIGYGILFRDSWRCFGSGWLDLYGLSGWFYSIKEYKMLFSLGFWVGFGAGGALIWFFKLQIQKLVMDANALSAKLHAQADAIAATVKKV